VFFELYRQRQQIASQRDKLEAQAIALEEAARRKDEFLLTLTHDLTLHKDARAQQDVLLREINHRIKNLFSLTSGLITLSARSADSVEELASDLTSRLRALADAHQLTLPDLASEGVPETSLTTVREVLKAILAPHASDNEGRIAIGGTDTSISSKALTSFALLLHELTTNAAKYGALSIPTGRLMIELSRSDEALRMDWTETTGPRPAQKSDRAGFGTALEKAVLRGLGASLHKDWREDGLAITIEVPLDSLAC
jgi:two-component sensor histidine kinase